MEIPGWQDPESPSTVNIYTLMSKPFPLLDENWLGGESHEVSLDNEVGILFAEEEWRFAVRVDVLSAATVRFVRHGV